MQLLKSASGLLLALMLSSNLAQARPLRVESGFLQGTKIGGLALYRGVPYATPPLGPLRWREPQSVSPWQGVRKADAFAAACMQTGVSMPGERPPTVNEDCLYLNIWTPARKSTAHLPVMVWIHGGGYSNGSASMPLYWGDRLARKGLIVVTVAYRLGPFGFLAHPELTRESAHHSSGNYGLLDQIAALEWIQRNIGAFGGDAGRVTVAGQSAGAMAVSALMSSPRAKGLFQRAIAESGGLFEPLALAPQYLLTHAEEKGEGYAASLGTSSIREMRQLPARALLGGTAAAIAHPVIEPYVLPESPYDVFAAGHQNDVPLLLGSNAEEARALADVSQLTASTFANDVERSFGPLPAAIIGAYPHDTDVRARQARLDLERDLRFGWDMWAWARLQARTGHHPVYYYSFDHQPPFPTGSFAEGWGASHYAELWYVFDHLDQESWKWTKGDHRLARSISSYWVNFARSGNPNGRHLPHWPAYDDTRGAVQQLDDLITVGTVHDSAGLEAFDAAYGTARGTPFGAGAE